MYRYETIKDTKFSNSTLIFFCDSETYIGFIEEKNITQVYVC